MKKILGLDLGVASIGWALVGESDTEKQILGMGVRIIPLSAEDANEFTAGNAISKNQKRTVRRTQRKGYDRYQLRRQFLHKKLEAMGMVPPAALFGLNAVELYGLRNKALEEKIELHELGRILFHLNQKRGYKSSKRDQSEDSKDTEYVKTVKDRYATIKTKGITVGQFFYFGLREDKHYTVKKQVFPRTAYMEEFDLIWENQRKYYPKVLTEENKEEIRDRIIYYQRPLKSQKGLVSICEFEGEFRKNSEGRDIFTGPKVAPKSSPLFQVCKIWETINNISIRNRRGEEFVISPEKKKQIFEYMDVNEKLTITELFKILEIGKNDGYYGNKQLKNGIQGNTTKTAILKALKDSPSNEKLIRFQLNQEEYDLLDRTTGELVKRRRVSSAFEQEPLCHLWHTIYSIPDEDQIINVLMSKFELDAGSSEKLAALDFTKMGFGNKSARAMRNILPYLADGYRYSEACLQAGYNHSDSITEAENLARPLAEKLKALSKNSLRQPVVEKILNQMINVVNAIIEQHGRPDEIRIELARELKQSKEERNNTFNNFSKRERENKKIAERLAEYGLRATRKNIEKWRLYEEIDGKEGKLNAVCIYCGGALNFAQSISGDGVEVEHIIPRVRLFDDSFLNKTLAHTACNSTKGNMTAFDFMQTKSQAEFEQYASLVDQLYKDQKISKAKRDKLLMPADKIPQDFISRQLRETQYISRKARELLMKVCRYVHATSGSVTEYLRHQWGWNDVLVNLQIDKFREAGLTEMKEIQDNGKTRLKEVIKGWSKRNDHRHHAIDALVVACTTPSFIKRLNDLNQMISGVDSSRSEELKKEDSLKTHVQRLRPFSTAQIENVASGILVSYKPGKKVATKGIRKIKRMNRVEVVQKNIIIPRGALSEESVYGKTQKKEFSIVKLGPSFTQVEQVADKRIKRILQKRLEAFNNDPARAFKGLKSNPVWLDEEKTQQLTGVPIWRYVNEYVIKYPLQSITAKDAEYIIDAKVRELVKKRLAMYGGNHKEAFKDLEGNPLWFNERAGIKIKTARLYTGLNIVAGIPGERNDGNGFYEKYVKPGNNHHIAIYEDGKGKKHEHVVSFWHAVERMKRGVPVVIRNPKDVWDKFTQTQDIKQDFLAHLPGDDWKYILSLQQNEMFVFNLNRSEVERAISSNDRDLISRNLFRLRKITSGNYWFNHQYETEPRESLMDKKIGRCVQASLTSLNAIKVRMNLIGEIIGVTD